MTLQTTVIGSMPKPDYINVPRWVEDGKVNQHWVERYNEFFSSKCRSDINELFRKAIQESLLLQEGLGIDVITDGEVTRDCYMYHFCRNLSGFSFLEQSKKICRNGAWECLLPKIVGRIEFGKQHVSIAKEWEASSKLSSFPVKYTLPGPMTIVDTTANEFYKDEALLYEDLIEVINKEVIALANAGCKYIQIDEPVMVRYPKEAVEFGIRNLARCFKGLPPDVMKIVHCCCGYPVYLDQTDYVKADQDAYDKVAESLDSAGLDAISIEDTHRRNDPKLFSKFKNTKIILGVIDVVKSRIETVDEIIDHVKSVLPYIPRQRLILAPDCGLIFLNEELVTSKLKNMVAAAKSI